MKQIRQKANTLFICVLVACLLLTGLIVGRAFLKNESEMVQQTPLEPMMETPSDIMQMPPEDPTREQYSIGSFVPPYSAAINGAELPEYTEPSSQSEELTSYLQRGGTSYIVLEQEGCTQLVVVSAVGTRAQIQYYQYEDGMWKEKPALKCEGHVGVGGVSNKKQEGDGTTPAGLYPVEDAFYTDQQPQTGLNAFQVTQDTYWVDDPDSIFYNQRVEGVAEKDWDSAEHMIDYPQYQYGFVVGYNMPAQYAAGSAIFFHIGSSATSGCIAVDEAMLLAYLKELNKSCHPHILIIN